MVTLSPVQQKMSMQIIICSYETEKFSSSHQVKRDISEACSFNLSHFRFVFLEFQVSEMFDVPSLLVNRRQADPHGLQFTEVHSGDQLWRDHQDAYQRTCTREKDIANPGATSAARLFFFLITATFPFLCKFMWLETIVQSGSKWTKASKVEVKFVTACGSRPVFVSFLFCIPPSTGIRGL